MHTDRPLVGWLFFTVAALGLPVAEAGARGRWPHGGGRARPAPRGVLTARDLVLTPSVGDPRISPDGKWVVFRVGRSRTKENNSFANLYLVPLRGGAVRRLTTTKKHDWAPRFSPDGKTIAFVSTRRGTPQLWTIPLRGGEAVQRSKRPLGVGGPLVFGRRGGRSFAPSRQSDTLAGI